MRWIAAERQSKKQCKLQCCCSYVFAWCKTFCTSVLNDRIARTHWSTLWRTFGAKGRRIVMILTNELPLWLISSKWKSSCTKCLECWNDTSASRRQERGIISNAANWWCACFCHVWTELLCLDAFWCNRYCKTSCCCNDVQSVHKCLWLNKTHGGTLGVEWW